MSRGKACLRVLVFTLIIACHATDAFALKQSLAHNELASLKSPEKVTTSKREFISSRFSRKDTLACTGNAPGPQYKCWNDQWARFNTIVASGGAIPMTGGILEMTGSIYMETGSNLTVSSLTASLRVEECAVLSSSVALSLSSADVVNIQKAAKSKEGAKYILVESSCNEASQMSVEIVNAPRECRVYSAKLVHEAGPNPGRFATYVVYNWSSSHCNIWWIILVSILAITAVLIGAMCLGKLLFCPRAKPPRRRVAYSE